MSNRRALITGITGQDGSYLAEFLLGKGYEVFGLSRSETGQLMEKIKPILDKVEFIKGDLLDELSLVDAIKHVEPHEVYNLAAQSVVSQSWLKPVYTGEVTALGALRLLEAIRQVNPQIRFYQASSSEMFGASRQSPQNEDTAFYPRSPYGVAKLYAHWITVNYRESYNMFSVSGILFNHESPRRGVDFVTRKITNTAARIKLGFAKELRLGSLDIKRDWGFAGDYVEAMWLMLQQDGPEDFIIATGEVHTIHDFVEEAFKYLGLNWQNYVRIDETIKRPAEVYVTCGDASKAKLKLGWSPKVKFTDLVKMMVESDLLELKKKV